MGAREDAASEEERSTSVFRARSPGGILRGDSLAADREVTLIRPSRPPDVLNVAKCCILLHVSKVPFNFAIPVLGGVLRPRSPDGTVAREVTRTRSSGTRHFFTSGIFRYFGHVSKLPFIFPILRGGRRFRKVVEFCSNF
jgi:hypothetical protein